MPKFFMFIALPCSVLFLPWTSVYGVRISFEEFKQHRMEKLRTDDNYLRSLY